MAKCAALLQERAYVAIVDLVTIRASNLYGDLLEFLGQADPSLGAGGPPLHGVACRRTRRGGVWVLETWAHPLALGEPLPMPPLWLAGDLAVPLELVLSYEETHRVLHIV